MADRQFANMPPQQPRGSAPLCFIVDEDFGLRQQVSKELRRQGTDVVEFSNSSRLLGMVDDQNPDIVLINVVGAAPHQSMRALLALKECRYGGAVQLFGNCEPKFLESLKVTGLDCGLKMLPPLRMPIKVATLHGIIREQKLGAPVVKGGGISLKDALARQAVTFLYQPKIDLKAGIVIGAEVGPHRRPAIRYHYTRSIPQGRRARNARGSDAFGGYQCAQDQRSLPQARRGA